MSMEIESKLKVDCLDEIRARLDLVGGEFVGELVQRDTFFTDAGGAIVNSDRGLRIRRERCKGEEKIFLTYKGPRQKTRFKSREEVEVGVDSFEALEQILLALGLEETIVVEKNRSLWTLKNCDVCLDQLAELGSYVEIEGQSEKDICVAMEELGLLDMPHVESSYARLIKEKKGGVS